MTNYTINRIEQKVGKMPSHYIFVGIVIILLALVCFLLTGYLVRYADKIDIESVINSADQNTVQFELPSKPFLNELSKNENVEIHQYTSRGHYQVFQASVYGINYNSGVVTISLKNAGKEKKTINNKYPLIMHVILTGKEKSIISRLLTGRSVTF
ncbi:hypothetical protein [Mucilaginibacter sp.]|uniref:hypothetical protein n=1 Tax=Mucilaginibacter sp. TaxID=1882438 RepID=UPI00260E3E81|nr:hypothetical protein [Mucilaginibacter sp.]MDB4926575.1 hypothetical protein [Mucilaginibacter sp.]